MKPPDKPVQPTLAFSTVKMVSVESDRAATPHRKTINANGKESHDGRQRCEKR
jgi:hypothetical protein